MDWDNIKERLIKVAVGSGENGIDAAFNGIRTWLEKGLVRQRYTVKIGVRVGRHSHKKDKRRIDSRHSRNNARR